MKTRAAALATGFALFLLTDILSFHATTAYSGLGWFGASFQDVYFIATIAARVVAYAVVSMVFVRSKTAALPPKPTAALATVASFVGLALIMSSSVCGYAASLPETAILALLATGAVVLGASQGIMSLVWLSTLTSFSYRGSYLFLIAGHGIATALCALVLLLPAEGLFPLLVIAVAMANACTLYVPRRKAQPSAVRSQLGDIAPHLWKGILAVGVFAFVSGFVSAASRQGPISIGPVDLQFFVLATSCIVLVVMIVPALAFHQPLKLEAGYRVALPLSALGFLVLPGLVEAIPAPIAGTLATTGYMLTGIVLYCTIAEMAKAAEVPPLPLLAGSDCVTLICLLAGTGLGLSLAPRLSQGGAGFALVGLGSLYLIALAAAWLARRPEQSSQNNERESRVADTEKAETASPSQSTRPSTETTVRTIDEVVLAYRLTEQESVVLGQLLAGRTTSRIAQELYLSQSAIKYHTQKIYRRFDVHSRSGLSEAIGLLCGGSPDRTAATDDIAHRYELTDREREVFDSLARGLAIAEIAQTLDISSNTVKTHVKCIYGKLGVHSKQEAIDLATKQDAPAPTSY
ncbi:response regulator transcription factor [Gordonibacter sp.]|uniref:response regulator transcription factor n=2 Tax=Gordonibacter sp. TaxID=1968902 RepID=UPI002FCB375C